MDSIFSTQNLQTFLRRKYLRPPSREPPGPPPGRGPRGPLRSLRSGRLSPPLDPARALGVFVSSALILLLSKKFVTGRARYSPLPDRQTIVTRSFKARPGKLNRC